MRKKILLLFLTAVVLAGDVVSAQGITEPIQSCRLRRTIQINIRVDGLTTNDIAEILVTTGATPVNSLVSSVPSEMTVANTTVVRDAGGAVDNVISAAQATEISKRWAIICLVNTINTVVDWVFYILISIVLLFIVIAAFLWLSSGGDPTQQRKAGAMIIAAVVGLVIAVMARIIPGIVVGIFAS